MISSIPDDPNLFNIDRVLGFYYAALALTFGNLGVFITRRKFYNKKNLVFWVISGCIIIIILVYVITELVFRPGSSWLTQSIIYWVCLIVAIWWIFKWCYNIILPDKLPIKS